MTVAIPEASDAALKPRLQRAFVAAIRPRQVRRAVRSLVRALPLPDPLLQRLPVEGPFSFEAYGREFTYSAGLNDGVGRALFWRRTEDYEPETLPVLVEYLRRAGTFLDVGANTGVFSLIALAVNPQISVHAFEPAAAVFDALQANVRANGAAERVTCNRVAVGSHVGSVPLHVPTETWGNARLGTEGFRGLEGHVEQVASTTLDAYVDACGLKVDVIKVDVEGLEHRVLEGAGNTLRQQRPTIVCECLPEADVTRIESIVRDCDYRAHHLVAAGPRPVEHVVPDGTDRFKNFLFLPLEAIDGAATAAGGPHRRPPAPGPRDSQAGGSRPGRDDAPGRPSG